MFFENSPGPWFLFKSFLMRHIFHDKSSKVWMEKVIILYVHVILSPRDTCLSDFMWFNLTFGNNQDHMSIDLPFKDKKVNVTN